jgi:type I restriction enzyme R subunit
VGVREGIAPKVSADPAYQNAMANTPHTASIAFDQVLAKAAQFLLKDDTAFYKQFVENDAFRRAVRDMVLHITSAPSQQPPAH